MKIWVDADACPVVIKKILFKAVDRMRVPLILVANHPMTIPQRTYIKFLRVSSGFDRADDTILELLEKGDLVITADIPLAARVLEKGDCPESQGLSLLQRLHRGAAAAEAIQREFEGQRH